MMTNSDRAEYGRLGAMAGNPDSAENITDEGGPAMVLSDTLANLRHYADSVGIDWQDALRRGDNHYHGEVWEEAEEAREDQAAAAAQYATRRDPSAQAENPARQCTARRKGHWCVRTAGHDGEHYSPLRGNWRDPHPVRGS